MVSTVVNSNEPRTYFFFVFVSGMFTGYWNKNWCILFLIYSLSFQLRYFSQTKIALATILGLASIKWRASKFTSFSKCKVSLYMYFPYVHMPVTGICHTMNWFNAHERFGVKMKRWCNVPRRKYHLDRGITMRWGHRSITPKFVTPTAPSCIDNSWRSTILPGVDSASSNLTLPFQNEHKWVLEKLR